MMSCSTSNLLDRENQSHQKQHGRSQQIPLRREPDSPAGVVGLDGGQLCPAWRRPELNPRRASTDGCHFAVFGMELDLIRTSRNIRGAPTNGDLACAFSSHKQNAAPSHDLAPGPPARAALVVRTSGGPSIRHGDFFGDAIKSTASRPMAVSPSCAVPRQRAAFGSSGLSSRPRAF